MNDLALPEVDDLSSVERLAQLTDLRLKQMHARDGKGKELSHIELNYVIKLIRVERSNAAAAKGKKPTSIVPAELGDF